IGAGSGAIRFDPSAQVVLKKEDMGELLLRIWVLGPDPDSLSQLRELPLALTDRSEDQWGLEMDDRVMGGLTKWRPDPGNPAIRERLRLLSLSTLLEITDKESPIPRIIRVQTCQLGSNRVGLFDFPLIDKNGRQFAARGGPKRPGDCVVANSL